MGSSLCVDKRMIEEQNRIEIEIRIIEKQRRMIEEQKHIEKQRRMIEEQKHIEKQRSIFEEQRRMVEEEKRIERERLMIEEEKRIEEKNFILNNIKNIGTIEEKYPNKLSILFQANLQNNLNDSTKYFYLLFNNTREVLFNSKYKEILLHTQDGINLLFQKKEYEMLATHTNGIHKLIDNNITDYLTYEQKLYLVFVKKINNPIINDVCKYAINNLAQKKFYRIYDKTYEIIFYDQHNYDRDGYNSNGYGKNGYDRDGYDIDGYDMDGYNRYGYDEKLCNKNGFYDHSYNRDGYNKKGYDKDGYDRDGYDWNGYDRDGYDRSGYNRSGYNCNGYIMNELIIYMIQLNDYDILFELSKYDIFYGALEKYNKICYIIDKKSGCEFLLETNNKKYSDLIYKNKNYLELLIDYESGRNILINDNENRYLLLGNKKGKNLLMKSGYENMIFEYYEKLNHNKTETLNKKIMCPLCRESNDKYKKNMTNDEVCCICLERYNDIKLVNCTHYFCEKCIFTLSS
jgi:hypothetical protein